LGRGERYVGTAGGGMDQAIILGAQAGCASRIDFHPLRLTPTAVPADWQFIVAWSLVHAEKSGAARQAYNERTRQCDEARRLVAALRERFYAPRGAADGVGRHMFTAEPSAGAEVLTPGASPG